MHDIGKLLIPKNITKKPGKQTDEERFYVRQHCDLGMSLLKDLNLSSICPDILSASTKSG